MSDDTLLLVALVCCVAIVTRLGDPRVLAVVAGLLIVAVLVDGVAP